MNPACSTAGAIDQQIDTSVQNAYFYVCTQFRNELHEAPQTETQLPRFSSSPSALITVELSNFLYNGLVGESRFVTQFGQGLHTTSIRP